MEPDISPWAVRGFFLTALIVGLSPAIDAVLTVWPLQPTDVIWRYGAVGLGAGYLPNVVFALALIIGLAYWQRRPTVLRVLGVAAIATTVVVLAVMALFALDVATVRALRAEEQRGAVLASAVVQQVKYLVAGAALASLGLGAMGSARGVSARSAGAPAGAPGSLRTGAG